MSSSNLPDIPSFRKQHLFLEFASLKFRCPTGIYLSLTPGDASLWSGVFFVRSGPYSPAILRINIAFPTQYPDLPPLVTFATDIFHPLLVPLTTHTFSASASDANDTFSASDGDRLPPGGFGLRDGFPGWFATPPQNAATNRPRIVEVLVYMKSTFEDATMLDNIPLEAAGNPGAWHAWQSHRGVSKASTPSISPIEAKRSPEAGSQTLPGNWNWEGVWESRVKIAIENSLSDPVLYGPKGGRGGDKRADMIRFTKMDPEQLKEICHLVVQMQSSGSNKT